MLSSVDYEVSAYSHSSVYVPPLHQIPASSHYTQRSIKRTCEGILVVLFLKLRWLNFNFGSVCVSHPFERELFLNGKSDEHSEQYVEYAVRPGIVEDPDQVVEPVLVNNPLRWSSLLSRSSECLPGSVHDERPQIYDPE